MTNQIIRFTIKLLVVFAILFNCITIKTFSQKNNSKTKFVPKKYIVIDNEAYELTNKAFSKIEIGWILSSSIPKEEELKKGEPILFYANSVYKEHIFQAIGIKEDNNIYTTLNSYADFRYKEGSTMEESLELYFKQNYKVPEKLRKKKYWWKVYVSAIVEKNGKLSSIELNSNEANKKVNPSLIEFIKNMPPWVPAMKSNEVVRSRCMFGVYFEWFNNKNGLQQ